MIEFDVLPEHADGTGGLFLAHDYIDLEKRRSEALTLEDGLELFRGEAYAGVELDLDLKLPGLRGPRDRRAARRGPARSAR